MFSKTLSKAAAFILPGLVAILAVMPAFAQPAPAVAPTKTGYEDFLRELGIADDNQVPEEILRENFRVTLRVLNRHMSETTDLTFTDKSGHSFEGELLISVAACIEEHDDIPGNDAAFVTIRGREGEVLFNGWMLRLFPSAAVFEHPRYDVLMRGCASTAG